MGKYVVLSQLESGLNDVIDKVKAEGYAKESSLGDLAVLDEVAETDLASALATKINGKADAATTLAGYNISDAYTKTEVDNAIAETQATAARPGGSLTAAEVVSGLLVAANEGKIYNLSEDITTTADFVDGAGKVIPAGANLWVINTATSGSAVYKFDVYAAAYGVATTSANGLMSATDKEKLDNADVTAYTGTGAISVSSHVISVGAASPSTSGVGGAAGTMSAADKEKLDNADVTAYTGDGTVVTVSNHVINVAGVSASTSGVGGHAGTMSATDKEKLDGIVQATDSEVETMLAGLHTLSA